MKSVYKITVLALLLSATSCIKDGFIGENCPGDYNVSVVWPGESSNDKKTTITITKPDGSVETITIGDTSNGNLNLDEGKYQISASTDYNKENVAINGNTVTVNKDTDGDCCDPGDFSGGGTEIEIAPGKDIDPNIQIPMIKQTRPLIVKVKFIGNAAPQVSDVSSTMKGIALSRHINHGFPPSDGEPRHQAIVATAVNYKHTKDNDEFYSGTRTLLGIDGIAKQKLSLKVGFGSATTVTYDFDISRDMDGFHITDVKEAWVIEIVLQLGADFQATIVDWKVGPETWLEAN